MGTYLRTLSLTDSDPWMAVGSYLAADFFRGPFQVEHQKCVEEVDMRKHPKGEGPKDIDEGFCISLWVVRNYRQSGRLQTKAHLHLSPAADSEQLESNNCICRLPGVISAWHRACHSGCLLSKQRNLSLYLL